MTIKPITFVYTNHRGLTSERTVTPDGIEFQANPGYGYQPGWFLSGYCHDKKARRSFALCNIVIQLSTEHAFFKLPIEAETQPVDAKD